MTYEDWYDKIGHKLEEDFDNWVLNAPDGVIVEDIELTIDYLERMYESMESEAIDRAYDEWKDRDI